MPFPESLSIGADGSIYVGSVKGGVVRVRAGTTAVESFVAPGAFDTHAVFGVLADPRQGMLCSARTISPRCAARAGRRRGAGSWLKGFDLKSGKGKVSARLPGEGNFCNDIAVDRDGAVYVTNTRKPEVLRLAPGATALAVWLSDPRFQSGGGGGLDGIAFGGDGNLYLNTFGRASCSASRSPAASPAR